MRSTFQFNTLYVIESLPDSEIQTGQILYSDIIKRSSERTGLHHAKLFSLRDRSSFIECLNTVRHYSRKGFHPFIHFEIHGDNQKRGLILKSGEIIYWNELADLTRHVNIITQNNLVISLATCYGAYFLTEINILKPAPFCGCVSTTGVLYIEEIIARFTVFFEALFEGTNFNIAVERLNNTGGLQYKFKFVTAKEIFEDSFSKMKNEDLNPDHSKYRNWVNRLTKGLKNDPMLQSVPQKKLKRMVIEQIDKKGKSLRSEIRKSFLLEN